MDGVKLFVFIALVFLMAGCFERCITEYECTDQQSSAAREFAKRCVLETWNGSLTCTQIAKKFECESIKVCQ